MHATFWPIKRRKRGSLEDIGVDGGTLLKCPRLNMVCVDGILSDQIVFNRPGFVNKAMDLS